jgi:hypothetical protein
MRDDTEFRHEKPPQFEMDEQILQVKGLMPEQVLGVKVIEKAILDYLMPASIGRQINYLQNPTYPTPADKRVAKEFLFEGQALEDWCDKFNFNYRTMAKAVRNIIARVKAVGHLPDGVGRLSKIGIEIW